MSRIGFIGIGKLGMPCAEMIAKKGHEVEGYDVTEKTSERIRVVSSIQEVVQNKDIVFIAVPTPHAKEYDGAAPSSHLKPRDFNYGIVRDCLEEANRHMNKDQLLVLISTVLPGTTRSQFVPLIDNTNFVYNPYLIAMGSVAWDMVNPEMVMIGTEDGLETGDARKLVDFYKTVMENDPRYIIGTWDECECIKIFYNTFISAKIGLVNMIQDVAEKQGNINVDVVTEALAGSTMRITGPQYMKAGMGDGAENMALKMIKLADDNNLEHIYIHGKAYKPGVPYTDGSYSLLVGHYVEKHGRFVTYIDPLTEKQNPVNVKGVVLLAHSASTTYQYMTGERNRNDDLYCNILPGSVVLDPWRKFQDEQLTVVHYGDTR